MTDADQELLWRYFDGDLPSEEATAFASRMTDDAELTAQHAMLEQSRTLMRAEISSAVEAADFSNFFAGVQAALGDEKLPTAAREAAPSPATSEPESLATRMGAWWKAYWTPVVMSAVAAGVVAFLVVRGGGGVPEDDDVLTTGPVMVDAVRNSGNHTVLISQPVEEGEATVIWLLEDEEEPEGSSTMGEDPI